MAFTLAQLSAMKRAQLQSLCKENELKANGKTEVLIQQLLDINASSSEAPAVAPAKKPAAAKKQAPTAVKKGVLVEDDAEDDDEMRMGSSAVVKKTKVVLPGKKKAAAELAPVSQDSESASASSSRGEAGGGEAGGSAGSSEIPHACGTSPATKAAIKDILATLESFRSELTMTREQVSTVQSSLAASDSRTTAVCERIEAEIETIRKERAEGQVGQDEAMRELDNLKGLLAEEVASGAQGRKVLEVRMGQLEEKLETMGGRSMSLKAFQEVSIRVDALGEAVVEAPVQAAEEEQRPSTSASLAPAFHQTASPTFSDAPPIVSLNSFSSPTPSVADSTHSPRLSNLLGSPSGAASRRSSPRKSMTSASAVSLPAHMLSVLRPRASPSPGKSRAAVAVAAAAPQSPVPASRQSLGKRGRYSESEASDSSARMAPSPSGSRPSTPAFGRRVAGVLGSAVRESGGWHLRKKLRLSDGTVDDEDDDDEQDEDEEEKKEGSGDTTVEDSRFADDDSLAMQTADEDSRSITQSEGDVDDDGDYFVQTKTGDELPAAVLPSVARAASPSAATPSLFGPSFFARDPLPSTSRKSLPAGASSFSSAAAVRKSLPLAALPFPIKSPYKALAVAAPRHSLAESSNRDSTGSGSSVAVPPTPQASKTLYGTERSLGDVTQGNDENENSVDEGMGSRFEDDEAVMTFGLGRGTPGKSWGVAKWGGFGSRA